MKEMMINQIIVPALVAIVGTILEMARRDIKSYIQKKEDLIEQQRQEVIQKIGIDKYNQDVSIAKGMIMSVEQMGKEYNWEGEVKHSKAVEIISQKTGLSADDIFNIIKATVAQLNKDKAKTVVINNSKV